MQQINKEDVEVLRAINTIGKYRAAHFSAERGFENIAALVQTLLDTTETFKCKKCGTEHQLYVIFG